MKRKKDIKNLTDVNRKIAEVENNIHEIRELLNGHETISKRVFTNIFRIVLVKEPEKHDGIMFYFNPNGDYLGEYDTDTGNFWLSNSNVWDVIRKECGYTYSQARESLTSLIEDYFGLSKVTVKKAAINKTINDYR